MKGTSEVRISLRLVGEIRRSGVALASLIGAGHNLPLTDIETQIYSRTPDRGIAEEEKIRSVI